MRLVMLALICALIAPIAQAQPIILLSNDDGYESDDLRALAHALNEDFIVFITAPRTNQSGMSSAISGLGREAEWSQFEFDGADLAYWIDATPAISVHLGIDMVQRSFGRPPDLVISGINGGANDGQSHWYSGTVGAARAARAYGLPALAVSLERGEDRDVEGAARWLNGFAASLIESEMDAFLNINFPTGEIGEDTPSILTYPAELRLEIFDRAAIPLTVENGMRSGTAQLWYRTSRQDDGTDSDVAVLARGQISVTPLTPEGFDLDQAERLWESQILD